MHVKLYTIYEPPNKVVKTLHNELEIEGVVFKDNNYLDVVTPKILIKLSDEITDYTCYNYFYIPKFTRYYYITDMSTVGGLVEITGKSDPLMSFKSDILGSEQYLSRSEKYRNKYIVDTLLPIHSDCRYVVKPFGEPVSYNECNHVILETIGKGGKPS